MNITHNTKGSFGCWIGRELFMYQNHIANTMFGSFSVALYKIQHTKNGVWLSFYNAA